MKKKLKTKCSRCEGTGIYSGMCEPEGTAVICHYCAGTGCDIVVYEPFTKRATTRKIKIVRVMGNIIKQPYVTEIPYKEFLADKRFMLKK